VLKDHYREAGFPTSQAAMNYVLRRLIFGGHALDDDDGPNDGATLGHEVANNVRASCLREQMVLDSTTDAALTV